MQNVRSMATSEYEICGNESTKSKVREALQKLALLVRVIKLRIAIDRLTNYRGNKKTRTKSVNVHLT